MSCSSIPEERHYFSFKASQTEARRPPSTIIPPEKHPMKLIFMRATEIHRIDDPSDITYGGTVTLVSEAKLNVRRNWIRYARHMLKALSAMLVPEDEQRVLIQRMYKECVPLWVTDIPITVVIADVTVRFSSDFRSSTTIASLDMVFDRTRDLRELEESIERYEPRFIPATKSSIEALEKVTHDSLDEAAASFTCGICQEGLDQLKAVEEGLDQLKAVEEEEDHVDIKPRTTITRLPCLHIYHETCIVQWLKISHLCPLCRHPLPTVEVGEQRNPA